MARVLFTIVPAFGHISPTIPVAKELQKSGNKIAYASGEKFGALLKKEGFMFYSVGPTGELKKIAKLYPKFTKLKGSKRQVYIFKEIIIPSVPGIVEELLQVISDFKPDVMVVDSITYAGAIAAEICKIRWATTSICPGLLPGKDAYPYGLGLPTPTGTISKLKTTLLKKIIEYLSFYLFDKDINRIRERFNLPPLKNAIITSTLSPYLYITFSIKEFEYPRKEWLPQVHFVGASIWDRQSEFKLPSWLINLPKDRPIVYVTFGTIQSFLQTNLFEIIMKALGDLDIQVIMTIGEEIEIENLPTPPNNFIVEQYVPNTYLLPKISCMVHHGGFNSTIAPIVYGVPVVVIPFEGDQLENAQRCVEAGIGIRLNYKKLTSNKLKQTILHILHEQKFKENVLKLKDKFAQYNAPKISAELLKKIL
jgi:MGT family glycosyltransferase